MTSHSDSVEPSTLVSVHEQDDRNWGFTVAKEIALAVASRLRPGAVPSWLPGLRRDPGPDSQIASAVATDRVLEGLDAVPGAVITHGEAPELTIVVCTRNRPASLARTLAALSDQRVVPGQIIVVDNAAVTDEVRSAVASMDAVRYVAEPRPGLSVARNTGLRHVATELVAFTDDDAEPHPAWTGQLARLFAADDDLFALTGLVLPASLETQAAQSFEFGFGGFSQGYAPRHYDVDWFRRVRWHAAPVWQVGAGANMAFRRRAFEAVGGFDERLGAGAAGCSEDSELWYRLLAAGHSCLYEPAAVVAHHHRADPDALEAQARAYAEGHVAALFVEFARSRHPGELVRAFVNLPAHIGGEVMANRGAPARAQMQGYYRGLRHARFAIRAQPPPRV